MSTCKPGFISHGAWLLPSARVGLWFLRQRRRLQCLRLWNTLGDSSGGRGCVCTYGIVDAFPLATVVTGGLTRAVVT
ncbi:hypothetical protein BJY00DRAFT_280033 [Aspergillus carlsbadensis]|nr:hypothetical protein BJY00DRAFT_280033 [Aspergillus carlsbadensis]